MGLTYRGAGVDIDAGNEMVRRIGPLARATRRPGVISDIGGFGGLFRMADAGYVRIGLDHFARPDDPLVAAMNRGELGRNFQGYVIQRTQALLGCGPSAISDSGVAVMVPAARSTTARSPCWSSS